MTIITSAMISGTFYLRSHALVQCDFAPRTERSSERTSDLTDATAFAKQEDFNGHAESRSDFVYRRCDGRGFSKHEMSKLLHTLHRLSPALTPYFTQRHSCDTEKCAGQHHMQLPNTSEAPLARHPWLQRLCHLGIPRCAALPSCVGSMRQARGL